jgi:hypothetical protein
MEAVISCHDQEDAPAPLKMRYGRTVRSSLDDYAGKADNATNAAAILHDWFLG